MLGLRRISIGQFVKDSMKVGMGTALAQTLAFLSLTILTRLFNPEAFSGWALWVSVATLFIMTASLRYELALVLPKKHENAAPIFVLGAMTTVAFSILSGLLLLFIKNWLVGEAFIDELRIWIYCMPLYIFGFGLFRLCSMWFARMKYFGLYAVSLVSLPLLQIISQIMMAMLGATDSAGMIIGTFLGQLILTSIVSCIVIVRHRRLLVENTDMVSIKRAIAEYSNYPLFMAPFTVLGAIRDRTIYFFMSTYASRALLGFYNLSFRVMNVPNSFLAASIRPVIFQKVAEVGVASIEMKLNKTIRTLMMVIVPLWVVFLFHRSIIFVFVFGEEWRPAGDIAAILSFSAVPFALSNWLDRLFDVLGRQRLVFVMQAVFTAVSILAVATGFLLFNDAWLAIILQTGISATFYCVWLYVLYLVAEFDMKYLANSVLIALALVILATSISYILTALTSPVWAIAISLVTLIPIVVVLCLRVWGRL